MRGAGFSTRQAARCGIDTARCSPSRIVSGPALGALAKLAGRGPVWVDCEALERRHNLGRSTLVVLDVVPESGTPSYLDRSRALESVLPIVPVFSGEASHGAPCGAVVLTPSLRTVSHIDALAFYQRLRAANRALGCDFFEGVVRKRVDSIYPVPLRSATEGCRGWRQHRSRRANSQDLRCPF